MDSHAIYVVAVVLGWLRDISIVGGIVALARNFHLFKNAKLGQIHE